jgi:hypothetical protein
MTRLNLTGRLLTCPTRTRAYVVKLKNWANPVTRQRGTKGSVISFPQDNAVAGHPMFAQSTNVLPRPLSELPDHLKVIFVGHKPPTDAQLTKVFRVDAHDVRASLDQWRANEHAGYTGTWSEENLSEIEAASADTSRMIRPCIYTASMVDEATAQAKSASLADLPLFRPTAETEAYEETDDVPLEHSGMVDSDEHSSNHEAKMTNAVNRLIDQAVQVPHKTEPVGQFDNPDFWVNTFPVLFPFGVGGSAHKDTYTTKLTVQEWVRHHLAYHDGRFRKDPSFIYVAFAVLQQLERLNLSFLMYKKVFSAKSTAATIKVTSAQLLASIQSMKTNKDQDLSGGKADIAKVIKNTTIVGAKLTGSVYQRGACRNEIVGLVTTLNLPNLFITINPSDITNPIVAYWTAETDRTAMQFNLDNLDDGDFPDQHGRALLVANDPVLPAQFFDTIIRAFLESFLGFEAPARDPKDKSSLKRGKLLNETLFTGSGSRGLKGFYGTVECQGRGSLHLHLLVWLAGLPAPSGPHNITFNITHCTSQQRADCSPTARAAQIDFSRFNLVHNVRVPPVLDPLGGASNIIWISP